jgi:tetratricopeptide (TPR) repeat protein
MSNQPIYVENELFLGRLDEQEQFRETLHKVLAPALDDNAPPFIFLIHGEGGMGKSQLTRRLYDIAATEAPFDRKLYALRVDWEMERDNKKNIALQVGREQIHPEAVLDALHRAGLDCGWGRHFKKYQDVIEQRRQAEQEVARALDREREQGQYTAIRDLGAAGLAKLVRLALPVGETGEKLSQALLAAGIQLGAEQVAQARQQAERFLQARLKPDLYDVYRQPHEQLARALGDGFCRVARERPLVFILDTYEIVALTADAWLHQVIKAAGPRLVWVLAGRDNLARSRPGERYVGYSADFTRGLMVWDIQELAIEYVTAYLADRAPHRPVTPDQAAALRRATLGVPLALKQAADLWAQGVELTAITEGIPDHAPREKLVRLMCERVLMHVEQDAAGPADRRALYALAMQPRPDPGVQTAILRPPDSGQPFDLSRRLADLARCYSVVRLTGGAGLHEAMGDFVREYLLRTEARMSDVVLDLAHRAATLLRIRQDDLAEGLNAEARLDSEDWQQTTLDLVHWLFWQDERAAWRELIPRFVEGLGYDQAFAAGLLKVAERFKLKLGLDGARRLKRLQDNNDRLDELARLAQSDWLDDADLTATAERRAILDLWQGRWLVYQENLHEALQACQATERRLPEGAINLRQQLGRVFYDLSGKFLWPEGAIDAVPTEAGLQAAQQATTLASENGVAWYRLGVALAKLGRHEETIKPFQRAIELDPKYASPHNGLGIVYAYLGHHDEAIAAFQHAIELDPKYAHPHYSLGIVYAYLGHHDEAIAAFQRAIQLDPKLAYPHHGLGNVYNYLGHHDKAIAACKKAIELGLERGGVYGSLAAALQKLGRETEAAEHLAHARKLMDKEDAFTKACIEAISGNTEAALDYLAEALAGRPGRCAWARRDPDLASLRGEPRFEALVGERVEDPKGL